MGVSVLAAPHDPSLREKSSRRSHGTRRWVRFGPQRQPMIQKFDEHSVRPTLHCSNPLCQQGGVDIESLLQRLTLSRATEQQETVHCWVTRVHRRAVIGAAVCLNYFRVKVSISYGT
jgi:hypothetical protein